MKKEYIIDLARVSRPETLHRKIAEVIPFPEDYGHNFDALFDFLTEYGAELKIIFKHAKTVPPTLKRVCEDAVDETPGLEIIFE